MKRGEVWLAVLDPVRGSEQAGTRPVLILQPDVLNAFLRTIVIAPFTTNLKWAGFPFCAQLAAGEGGLPNDSVLLGHQIRVADKSRLLRRLGALSGPELANVERAVRMAQGL